MIFHMFDTKKRFVLDGIPAIVLKTELRNLSQNRNLQWTNLWDKSQSMALSSFELTLFIHTSTWSVLLDHEVPDQLMHICHCWSLQVWFSWNECRCSQGTVLYSTWSLLYKLCSLRGVGFFHSLRREKDDSDPRTKEDELFSFLQQVRRMNIW